LYIIVPFVSGAWQEARPDSPASTATPPHNHPQGPETSLRKQDADKCRPPLDFKSAIHPGTLVASMEVTHQSSDGAVHVSIPPECSSSNDGQPSAQQDGNSSADVPFVSLHLQTQLDVRCSS
ncbi:uncharacterized protein LOC108679645, partial [Hyalella azteca]|uniref:Uncharacterized protein LOC108679645 n=1 Tax=Hyalella azteca TaxID=294128 RepID=A0A979FWT4_HYAAZ